MRATPYAILYIVPAVLSAGLAIYGWRRRQRSGAIPFSMLMLAIAFWCGCHAAAVASTSFDTILFWTQAQYAGIVSVGPFWLLFATAYANRNNWTPLAVRVAMFSIAALSYAVVLTNGSHNLWWTSIGLADRPFGTLRVERGLVFWAHAGLSYTYLLIGIGLFIHRALDTSRFYQRQARLVIIGALVPFIGNLALLAGVNLPIVDDPTPFLLLASGVLLFYASSRYQLLDLAPIAQREVFESMPDGVIVLDPRGIVTSVNTSARKFLPFSAQNTIGRRIDQLLDTSPLALDVTHMLAASSEPQTRRLTYAMTDGTHGVEIRLQPLYERQGQQAGALLVLRDTTAQVRAEQSRDQRLREVSLLQQIARAANSVAQTDDVLRIISAEMLRVLPWHRVIIGMLQPDNVTLRLIADQLSAGEATLEGRFVDAYTFGIVIELMRAGQPRVLHVSDPLLSGTPTEAAFRQLNMQTVLFVPLISRDQPMGMLFVGSNGERSIPPDELRLFETIGKLISDTLVRTQLYDAAHEANTLKSAFLATVSHELRTPLTSIIGFADMLQAKLFGPLPPAADEAVEHIQRGSYVLLRQINDILDFSKMEAGHFAVDLYPVDVGLVVRMVSGIMQPQLYDRGLTLTLDLPPDLPLIQSNSARLEQVLTNLIANAIKFTENGGITITAAVIGQKVRVSVRDTGIGIAPEHQPLIFDTFRQIDNSLTRRYGGTGLGLAISKRLIELMGGTISLESELGVGTTFYCDFHIASFETFHEHAATAYEQHTEVAPHSSIP